MNIKAPLYLLHTIKIYIPIVIIPINRGSLHQLHAVSAYAVGSRKVILQLRCKPIIGTVFLTVFFIKRLHPFVDMGCFSVMLLSHSLTFKTYHFLPLY